MKTSVRHLAFLLIGCAMGCTSFGCITRPNLGPPGTIYHQRNQAVLHDPFPERESGPAIEGARPMGFDLPLSEPKRSQTNPYAQRGGYGY